MHTIIRDLDGNRTRNEHGCRSKPTHPDKNSGSRIIRSSWYSHLHTRAHSRSTINTTSGCQVQCTRHKHNFTTTSNLRYNASHMDHAAL